MPDADRFASRPGLIVALDTIDLPLARRWMAAVAPHADMVKLGPAFFGAHGPKGYRAIKELPIFLDLKLHDVPSIIAAAVRALLPLAPHFLTLHAAGGAAMIAAACEAARSGGPKRPRLLAVTVLSSFDAKALKAIGIADPPSIQALRLARLALAAGADGLVCAPTEVALLRRELGPAPLLVVPAIRPAGSSSADQARFATPKAAVRAGASYLVVGRPITEALDPAATAAAIRAEMVR